MPRSSLCGFTECSACQKNKSLGGLFSSNGRRSLKAVSHFFSVPHSSTAPPPGYCTVLQVEQKLDAVIPATGLLPSLLLTGLCRFLCAFFFLQFFADELSHLLPPIRVILLICIRVIIKITIGLIVGLEEHVDIYNQGKATLE